MQKLRNILSVTSVRLSIAYTLIFSLVAILIVVYMTASTADLLRRQIADSVDREVAELAALYEAAGMNGVMRRLERSASAPGANLYAVADPAGLIFAGNVRDLGAGVIDHEGWTPRPFPYTRFEEGDRVYRAVARVVELPNGMRMLVGRDLGEPERFRELVGRAIVFSIAAMVMVGVAIWLVVGRRALKRVELVSLSTSRIMAGDRSERLPVTTAGDEFDALSARLNEMLDRIGQLDDGLKQVSDNIAHDLKTPLTRLRNKADAAALSADNPRSREALQEIIADTDQIIRTFDALLMISRVESGSVAAALSEQDLSSIAADVAELYEPVVEDQGGVLAVEIDSGARVRGNRELLGQALSNLLDNAIKYGIAGGTVTLRLSTGEGRAVLSVCDRGPGIPAADRDKALTRFGRLEASRNRPGNGLGLSLVRAVAQLHGGVFELADNSPGLCAIMRLPLLQGAVR